MPSLNLPIHRTLQSTSRLSWNHAESSKLRTWEWACLIGAGIGAAAASALFDFSLRIPGHAILRAIFPMAIGLALVPRRGAGSVMACSALVAAMGFRLGGMTDGGMSFGALTSLTATGPLLDWTLHRAHTGWTVYARFACAGMASNGLALVVRTTAKLLPWQHAGGKPLAAWLPTASVTYLLCGIVAGLLSGAIWFAARPRNQEQ